MVPSLKDAQAGAFVRSALERLAPAVIVTATAFAAGGDGETSPLDGVDAPVLQAVIATTRRAAWQESPRGLGPADLAMHVVLPELDGRVLAGAIAFKDALPKEEALAFAAHVSRPEPDRVEIVADRIAALARLQRTPRAERRVAVLMPDYPAAGGRAGYAVGLDVPASVLALLADLGEAGYGVSAQPDCAAALLEALRGGQRRGRAAAAAIIGGCSPHFLPRSPRPSTRHGAMPPTMTMSATAPSGFAPPRSAMWWWRCRPSVAGSPTAAPAITIRYCRRAMPCSPSVYGCVTWSRPMPSCIWARTARSNGCRARPWR